MRDHCSSAAEAGLRVLSRDEVCACFVLFLRGGPFLKDCHSKVSFERPFLPIEQRKDHLHTALFDWSFHDFISFHCPSNEFLGKFGYIKGRKPGYLAPLGHERELKTFLQAFTQTLWTFIAARSFPWNIFKIIIITLLSISITSFDGGTLLCRKS